MYLIKNERGTRIYDPEVAKETVTSFYEKLYQPRKIVEEIKEWQTTIDQQMIFYEKVREYDKLHINREITLNEIKDGIKILQKGKATGPDDIPNDFLIEGGRSVQVILWKVFNQIFAQEKVPEDWKEAEIISIYKGKGDPEVIGNYRGISIASNLGKLFERILNNRVKEVITYTEAQAGGRAKYSTVDQLYILKSLMNRANAEKKKLYIAYFDLEKAYDRAWKQIIFHTLWQNGVKGKTWRIVKKINDGLFTRVRTRYGLTREVLIPESIRQGGVLSVVEFSKMMDMLNVMIEKEGYRVWIGDIRLPCLLFMDDAVIVEDDPERFQGALEVTNRFIKFYKLVLNHTKSKVMIINKDEQDQDRIWKVGNMELESVDKYTYLREVLTTNGKLEEHIKSKESKINGLVNQIRAMSKETLMNRMSLDPQLTLFESTVIPTLLYGCETWSLGKTIEGKLEQLQLKSLRRILQVPKSTPIPAFYIEAGILPIKYQIDIKKLNYLYKIVNMEENRWQNYTYKQITAWYNNIGHQWIGQTQNYELWYTLNDIRQMTKNKWKTLVQDKVTKKAEEEILDKVRQMKKLTELKTQGEVKIVKKQYLKELPRQYAQIIFKARTRMLPSRNNYKNMRKEGSLEDEVCQRCEQQKDSEKHLIEECLSVERRKDENDIRYVHAFKGSREEKKKLAKLLCRIILGE